MEIPDIKESILIEDIQSQKPVVELETSEMVPQSAKQSLEEIKEKATVSIEETYSAEEEKILSGRRKRPKHTRKDSDKQIVLEESPSSVIIEEITADELEPSLKDDHEVNVEVTETFSEGPQKKL